MRIFADAAAAYLHLGLDSELHHAVVTVEQLDIRHDVVLINNYTFKFLRKSCLVYLWLKNRNTVVEVVKIRGSVVFAARLWITLSYNVTIL
jgi:hypothetical protein